MSVSVDTLPPAILESARAVLWNHQVRDGKPTKVPYQAQRPARTAAVDDPTTWAPMSTAIAAYQDGKADGVGIVLGDGLVGVDLDHVRDAETGGLASEAVSIIAELDSYAEISPSGTGVHVLVRGALPPGGRRTRGLEMYSADRYFTLTGQHLPGTPRAIEERTAELAALHARTFPSNGKTHAAAPRPSVPVDLDDAALLDKARGARNGAKFAALWAGDCSGHASHSEADQALCNLLAFWTGADAARMDALFRQSNLMRPKWDERHGPATYGQLTIDKAIAGCTETYSGPRPTVVSVEAPMPEPEPEAVPVMPEPYTFASAVPVDHFLSEWIAYAGSRTDAAHAYHELAALTLLASMTPNVRAKLTPYPDGLGTNFYALMIGDSTTSRKSTSKDLARDVLFRTLPGSLCPDAFSPEGFVEKLASRPKQSTTLYVDEFGELLAKLAHAKHMAGMRGLLLTIYGGSSYIYRRHSKRAAKTGEKILDEDVITDPHLSILGATTPAVFEMLVESDVLSGLLPRFVVCMPSGKPERRPFFEDDGDLGIARNRLVGWLGRLLEWSTSSPVSRSVRFDPGVLQRLDHECFLPLEQAGVHENDVGRAMLSRLSAVAVKCCLLVAAGRPDAVSHSDLLVTNEDAVAAMTIVRRFQTDALAFAHRIGESVFERSAQKCLTLVRLRRSVPRHVIARLIRLDKKMLDGIRDTLLDRQDISVAIVKAAAGRTGEIWQAESAEGGV